MLRLSQLHWALLSLSNTFGNCSPFGHFGQPELNINDTIVVKGHCAEEMHHTSKYRTLKRCANKDNTKNFPQKASLWSWLLLVIPSCLFFWLCFCSTDSSSCCCEEKESGKLKVMGKQRWSFGGARGICSVSLFHATVFLSGRADDHVLNCLLLCVILYTYHFQPCRHRHIVAL